MNKTKKIYYQDPFLTSCEAEVLEVSKNGVLCNQTVAFPEGGGQKGDSGFMLVKNSKQVAFYDTQKGKGRLLKITDFPTIEVDTPVYHKVNQEDLPKLNIGDKVLIKIDVERRARLTLSHSGAHLLMMGIEEIYPDLTKNVKGVSITTEYARLDFFKENKFTPEDLQKIKFNVNKIIVENLKIEVFPHQDEPEAFYWKCQGKTYACGGTHLTSTKYLGEVVLKRKNIGKRLERIIVKFPQAELPLELYST